MSMSTPTPTPTPVPSTIDEVTQPSAASPGVSDSGETVAKRLELTPAQWEAEALVTAEEAEARASSTSLSGALRYAAARMLSDRVGDAAAAIEHLMLAVASPAGTTFPPVLRALRLHALDAGSVWSALDQLDVEIGASVMVTDRVSLLVEKSYLLEDRLLAAEPARAVLEQALGLVAGHRGALAAAQAIAERGDDPTFLRGVLERRLAAASSPSERARVLTRLALIAESDADRLLEALTLFGRALDEDARGDSAFVARSGLRRAAARLDREVELMRGFTLESEALEAGPARAAWLTQAAAVARHRLGASERATMLVEKALADDPDDVALLATACEDHLAAGRWSRALALLDHQAELTTDRDWAAALWAIAGHIAERRLGDDHAAVERFRRAREVNPSNPSTLAALERIASRTGDTKTQVQLAVAAVGRAEDPSERAALAVRASEINESAMHDIEAAIAMARQALDAVPGYPPAVHLLERLYPLLERWDEMLSLVDADADADAATMANLNEDDDVAGRRLERLGLLQEERLGDPGAAMALFNEWALLGPRRPAALRALLRAAEKAGDALVAAEAALKLGTEVPGFTEDTQVAWRYRAATIFEERAAADSEAIRAYESALALAPGFRPALAGLARAHERRKSFEALAVVLSRRAEFESNPAHASVLEVEAAQIEAENLGRAEGALEMLGRALAFDTTNLGAVDYYVRMLQRLGRGDELEAALGTLAEKLSDPVAKAAIYRRQAEVFEWLLRRPREALASIERALALGATNRTRAAGTAAAEVVQERLYLTVGRVGEALALGASRLADGPLAPVGRGAIEAAHDNLRRRIDLALRSPSAEQAAAQLGRVFEDPTVLETAKAGGDRGGAPLLALEAQVAALRRLGREREAGFALEQLAAATPDPETRVALWRCAIAARERLGEAGVAVLPLYERIVDAAPELDALTVFERLATAKGDAARVIVARRLLAEHAPDQLTRAVFLWELGLAHADAGDLRGAAADFERALELGAPDEAFLPALRALARLREHTGELRGAAELWIREARQTKLVERATRAFRHAARLYANAIRDERSAAECLESVVSLDPDAEVDFQVLSVILRHQHQEDRLVQIMRQRAAEGTPEQRRDRLLQLADLLHERGSAEAVEALSAAVELDPTSGAALVRLAEMLAETGRPAEAVATFRRAIGVSPDAKLVSSAWIRIGDISAADLGDVALSVEAYRNALLSSADDIRALGGLLRGLLQQRDYANAALISRRLGTVDPNRDARVGHWIALGELLAGAGEDPEGSAEAFEQALELDPRHDHAIDRLDALLIQLDEPARLAAALGRYLAEAPQSTPRRMRLASLFSGPLELRNRAVDELRLVTNTTPDHVPARAELARVLDESGRLPEAVLEHLALLRLMPLRVESLRALRRLFERSGDRARTARATAALAAVGAIDAVEIRAVREGRTHYAGEPTGTVTAADFDMFIRHPDEHHPATALLAAMVDVLPRFYLVNIEDWGVTKSDRLGPRSEDPIRSFVHRVATVFGITEPFDIYLARTGTPQVQIEATQPPALLVPATLLGLPRQEALLQLGRQLGRLRAGTYPAARIPPKDLGLLVAAGVRTMFPEYARGALPEDKLNELSQKITRALPRRNRRAFEQAALSFRDGGVFDADRWRVGLSMTAYRSAILVSGDVLGAFERIARGDRRLAAASTGSSEEILKAARANPEVVDMINFALGEELAGLERRLSGN
ncbi:MAG TPA: tetratricopeptide repeat protein [Polyangia bacterium]|nr:tetratricopeptide repeat protein [Polyangia bacterium]